MSQHSGSQVFGLLIVAFAFLWIAISGSTRVLKVLDRRATLLGNTFRLANPSGHQVSTLRFSASMQQGPMTPRHSSIIGAGSAGLHGSTLTDSIWSDNRFLFGAAAVAVGVLRGTYVFMVLMLSNKENQRDNESISGDNLVSDTVTAPLAVLFYSLCSSILWALRDLLLRIRMSMNVMSPGGTQSPGLMSTPGLTPAKLGNIAASNSTETNTVTSSDDLPNAKSAGGGAAAVNMMDTSSAPDTPPCYATLLARLQPFAAVITSLLIMIVTVVTLSVAWGIKHRDGDDLTVRKFPAAVSSSISFCLMLWCVSLTIQAINTLKAVGVAAHRVVVAFVVMTIFLMLRGLLIMPPVQNSICGHNAGAEGFWQCTWTYSMIDAGGVGVVLVLLP